MTSHSHSRNSSLQKWQSKRCDFCMYHELIFDQLERLKQAMIIKNQRIKELQDFISKMSEMAFMKNPIMSVPHQINTVLMPKNLDANEDQNSSISLNSQNESKNFFLKKKSQEQSEISFQDMKLNTAKFQVKKKQSPDFISRFEKIKELNQLKKKLDKQISQTADKQNTSFSQRMESFNNSRQYETIRTLSQPQQQGRIGSIAQSSCQSTSRLREFEQQKPKFQDLMNSLNSQTDKATNQSLRKSNSFEDKNSINLIKQYIKKLQ